MGRCGRPSVAWRPCSSSMASATRRISASGTRSLHRLAITLRSSASNPAAPTQGPHKSRWRGSPPPLLGQLAVEIVVQPLDGLVAVDEARGRLARPPTLPVCPALPVSHSFALPTSAPSAAADQAASHSHIVQRLLERPSSPVDPAHDRADRHVGDLGDLLVGESLDVGQQHGHPERLGQRLDGRLHVLVGEAVERLVLGARARSAPPDAGQALVEVEVLDVLDVGDLGTALGRPVGVDVGVGEDPVEPGPQVGALREAEPKAR